jgi:hypothetical protein
LLREYPTKFDFKTNELFKPAADSHFDACVGDNGGPYDLASYADGFFDGGHAIIKDVKAGNFKVDVLVYPAAFSYRHGIELYLKHLFQLLAEWNHTSPNYPKHHTVRAFWEHVSAELQKVKQLKNVDKISRAEDLIRWPKSAKTLHVVSLFIAVGGRPGKIGWFGLRLPVRIRGGALFRGANRSLFPVSDRPGNCEIKGRDWCPVWAVKTPICGRLQSPAATPSCMRRQYREDF